MTALELLALLIVGHALCDYPLQGDFLSRAKNHTAPLSGVPWWQALGAHAVIHGGMVGLLTGSLWLGIAETVVHFAIDRGKCAGRYGYNVDQGLHIVCKLVWVAALLIAGQP